MAFTSGRRSWITGRPSWEAEGINGSNCCHWVLVRSEGERRPSSRLMPNIPFSIALGAQEVLLSFLYRQGGQGYDNDSFIFGPFVLVIALMHLKLFIRV